MQNLRFEQAYPVLFLAFTCFGWLIGTESVHAAPPGASCTPTNIAYCKKNKTLLGAQYSTYSVRCSDGTKRVISSWEGRKAWCIGEQQQKCTNDQLGAAKMACSN